MTNEPNRIEAAYVFLPEIKEFVSIIGSCLQNGKFCLIWKTNTKKLGTIDPSTFAELSKKYVVPF
jgi:hypothetical protein